MKWEIAHPKILLLSNSLGYANDEKDFMDLESDIKQEDAFIRTVIKKIDQVSPNIIFVQNDTSMKAIETLLDKNITVITNVKPSIMKRIGRLTQTISCPSTNLITPDFILGKCENFKMESLQSRPNLKGD
jgi:1-phosphatidylinositol-3-phosphate 5-kinase